jgi:hypothetical protein
MRKRGAKPEGGAVDVSKHILGYFLIFSTMSLMKDISRHLFLPVVVYSDFALELESSTYLLLRFLLLPVSSKEM